MDEQTNFFFEEVRVPELELFEQSAIGHIRRRIAPASTEKPIGFSDWKPHRVAEGQLFRFDAERQLLCVQKKSAIKDRKLDFPVLLETKDTWEWLEHPKRRREIEIVQSDTPSQLRDKIRESWVDGFRYKEEQSRRDIKGLRKPQIGALHATSAHWSLSDEPATIVLPTGTGKTETMLSILISERCECLLVVVPSIALRNQTAGKFLTLGILQKFGIVESGVKLPVVGVIQKRPKSVEDLRIFEQCNVIVAVVDSISRGTAVPLLPRIAARCSHLILDEAHHVAAKSWNILKEAFRGKKVLQFTATPYREDRSPLGGRVVYDYPLHRAQDEGFFMPIQFRGVFEVDRKEADRSIAECAIQQLHEDLKGNLDHRIMARCSSIPRAEQVLKIYREKVPEWKPVLIHSNEKQVEEKIQSVRNGERKVIVSVNMLAEGFDMPELKVAAMHDVFKSLAITLQFTGRFARTNESRGILGSATLVANTGFVGVEKSLQGLYDEDSDWNTLIAGLSFARIEEEKRFQEFLNESEPLESPEVELSEIAEQFSPQSLVPRFNAVVYRVKDFNPLGIRNGLEKNHHYVRSWEHSDPKVTFFITLLNEKPQWNRSPVAQNSEWHLFALYHDSQRGLLYIGSSFSAATNHQKLAEAVSSKPKRISEEDVFRVFSGINLLALKQVGLLRQGPRNLRYSMFTGMDVKEAISRVLSGDAQKSNLFGVGFASGEPTGIGCSRKGKIWGRDAGPLRQWTEWCDVVGKRLLDDKFDVAALIENTLTSEPIKKWPKKDVWFVDWPDQLLHRDESNTRFLHAFSEIPFYCCEINVVEISASKNVVRIALRAEGKSGFLEEVLTLNLGGHQRGYKFSHESGVKFKIQVGNQTHAAFEYFNEYPPVLTFTDQATLEGCLLVEPKSPEDEFPNGQLLVQSWEGVDLTVESRFREGVYRENSIQEFVMNRCTEEGFEIVFDDDDTNEIADVICIRDTGSGLHVRFIHCKFSGEEKSGARIRDVVEVTAQAGKSLRWLWNFKKLSARMAKRHTDRKKRGEGRFFVGGLPLLNRFQRLSEISGVVTKEVVVAQPGVSKKKITDQMKTVLGSGDTYMKLRIETPLVVWCSE